MASETQSGGTFANDAAVGTVDWQNMSNAQSSDNAYAGTAASLSSTSISKYLKVSNFGFSIPEGATINGIKVRIERKQQYNVPPFDYLNDNSVRLLYKGAWDGDDKASADYWSTSDTYKEYGGSSDLWGLGFDDDTINASNFGVGLSVKGISSTPNKPLVDHIEIIVYYTEAAERRIMVIS